MSGGTLLGAALVGLAMLAPAAGGAGEPAFVAETVYHAPSTIYALAWGEFDPASAGNEAACLLADGSVVELTRHSTGWTGTQIHKGLTPIGGMIDRPTICIGDVHSGFPGNEIVIDGGKHLTVLRRGAGWSYEILFTVGSTGAGWGSRVGDIDPDHPGEEILHSLEGVMDRGTIGVFRESGGTWAEEIVYSEHVVMDCAVGEFDPLHPGAEFVAVTEMGPAYEIYPPTGNPTGYWPRRTLWDDMENAGWVARIADVEPDIPGNEIIYGTRYNDRITLSYAAGSTGHQLEVLFTGNAPPGYRSMYDIAIGDVLPGAAGREILGVDASGSVYLVRRLARSLWHGQVIWQDPTGPLHAVVAGDLLPDRLG
ncbi:MAG TPA: hypothetical protein PLC79_06275, partial [Phycisphaerae bacterium]|nr:hypothetical protein [Phycisphaerae bacterium]